MDFLDIMSSVVKDVKINDKVMRDLSVMLHDMGQLQYEKVETNDKVIRDLVDKANQNDIQPEKIQLEVQKKNEVIEKIEELCQENIWL
jgi:hypothetical protein